MQRIQTTVWRAHSGEELLTERDEGQKVEVIPATCDRAKGAELRDALTDWLNDEKDSDIDPFTAANWVTHSHTRELLRVLNSSPRHSPGREWFLSPTGQLDYHNALAEPACGAEEL